MARYSGIIDKYRAWLPLADEVSAVSLCEGNTPLIALPSLAAEMPGDLTIYAKFEGLNPTASFKDRGMTVAVSQAMHEGARAIICASTGNTSASAAAYAARAGITAFVVIPEGKIALGKLAQARMHGAVVLQIQGNFDEGLALVKTVAEASPVTIVNSINPYRLQGQKTIAFEIIDELGKAPDYHVLPVGNAGNITASWMGYQAYYKAGLCRTLPVMLGFQAQGAAPFIHGKPVAKPETVATAIRIGAPQSWEPALEAQQASKGWFAAVSDEQILAAQRLLAETEGVFCEPASAAGIAGLLMEVGLGKITAKSTVVCTLTGHGLKDPELAISQSGQSVHEVPTDAKAVSTLILQHCQ